MDDIVVIILTLIVAVFGILNKKRKKNVVPEETASGAGGMQNFWEMLMDDNENVPPRPQPQPQVIQDEEIDEEPVRQAKPKFEYVTETKTSAPLKRKMQRAKASKKKSLILGEKFSLKKAVIYSEIINRKYT